MKLIVICQSVFIILLFVNLCQSNSRLTRSKANEKFWRESTEKTLKMLDDLSSRINQHDFSK